MVNQEQLKEIRGRIEAIGNYLKIGEKRMQLKEEELKSQDPGFWDNPKKAEQQMKTIRGIKFWVESVDVLNTAMDDVEVLLDFVKEGAAEPDEVDQSYATLLQQVEEIEL
jgi:peptide chain release factor 2